MPTAPFAQPIPGTFGVNSPRPLPAHWSTAGLRHPRSSRQVVEAQLDWPIDQPADRQPPAASPRRRRPEVAADEELVVRRDPLAERRHRRLGVERDEVSDDQRAAALARPVRPGSRPTPDHAQTPTPAAPPAARRSTSRRLGIGPSPVDSRVISSPSGCTPAQPGSVYPFQCIDGNAYRQPARRTTRRPHRL